MTMREDLEKIVSGDGWVSTDANYFLRDHGQALLEAVRDAERIAWFADNEGCNLISDDGGKWAVSTGGFQPVPEDGGFTESVVITSFVEPEEWMPSVRGAIDAVIDAERVK